LVLTFAHFIAFFTLTQLKQLRCKIWGSHSSAAEYSSLLGCDDVLVGKCSTCFKVEVPKFWMTKLCKVAPNIFIQFLQFFFPYTQKSVSVHLHWAESTRLQQGSQVTPEFWILSMDLAFCHLSGI